MYVGGWVPEAWRKEGQSGWGDAVGGNAGVDSGDASNGVGGETEDAAEGGAQGEVPAGSREAIPPGSFRHGAVPDDGSVAAGVWWRWYRRLYDHDAVAGAWLVSGSGGSCMYAVWTELDYLSTPPRPATFTILRVEFPAEQIHAMLHLKVERYWTAIHRLLTRLPWHRQRRAPLANRITCRCCRLAKHRQSLRRAARS